MLGVQFIPSCVITNCNIRKAVLVVGISIVLLLASVPLFSQGSTGRILGSVTDQSGAAIPNALVTITDINRGTARTLNTDSAGAYNAPNLLPGTYTVRV